MTALSQVALYAIAGFYLLLGLEIARRACFPSCRNCAYRHGCQGRRLGLEHSSVTRCWEDPEDIQELR